MTETTKPFDWNHARAFLAVAEGGSLSAAARRLGQTQPTISRQIAALEDALGLTLFERTGRSVHLTQAGVDLLDHVRTMSEGANMVSLAASGRARSIEGLVRITASEMMSAYILPRFLPGLRAQAPRLELEIIADNEPRDLLHREADIAIRHLRPDQPDLMMRRLSDLTFRFYAATAYLDRHGTPAPDALEGHQIVSYVSAARMLGYLRPAGLALSEANILVSTSSQCVAWELARGGHGMIVAPDLAVARDPDMRPVLSEIPPFTVPTWLVAHRELRTSRRIRLVFDHLVDALK